MAGLRVFVSHAGPDRAWAEWVAWHLDQAGYEVELDLWWSVGESFVARMRQALDTADVVVALWSAAYFEHERFTSPEWESVIAVRDGTGPRLVPLRVEPVMPPTLLRALLWADLFGREPEHARATLLKAVRGPRRPDTEPPLPDSAVPAGSPGAAAGGPRLPGVLPRVWNVPPRMAVFTGRDRMLIDLRDRMSLGGPVVVQALQGQGGVGKTQLAIEYAHRFANGYEQVWWVDAEQPGLIGEQLAAMAAAMGVAKTDTAVPTAVAALRARLGTTPGWLVVFDNAAEPDDLMPWLLQGPGQVLITSRHGQWRHLAAGCVDVDVFARTESVTLLRRLAPTVSEADAETIAQRLGDLPLAVTQAAGVLSETPITAADYLDELGRHATAVLSEGRPVTYPRPLAASLRLSVERLGADDPAAVQLLHICAVLAPEPIPLDLFTAAPTAAVPPPLGTIAGSPMAFGRTAARLIRYGLAKRSDPDQPGGTEGLLLHRLTQDVVRDLLDAADLAAVRAQAEVLLVEAHPADADDPVWWPRWAALLPHVLAQRPEESDNWDLRSFAVQATWFVLARGDLAAGLPMAERLLTGWRERLGDDHEHTMEAAHNVARGYRDQGRFDRALELDEDTYTRRRRILGDDHPATLASANNLAFNLREVGEHDRSRELDEDSYARYRQVLGDDHPHTLNSAASLAADLYATGEYERSRVVEEETYTRRRRVLGDDHPDTLRSAHNLAFDLRHAGEHDRARELDEDTYARRRRVLGDDHPDTLRSAANLAYDLRQAGEHDRARGLEEETYARRRRVLGDDHPDTLRSAVNLTADGGADPEAL